MQSKIKKFLILSGIVVLMGSSTAWGQAAPTSQGGGEREENLFSVWVKLSLIGYSQSEIESALSYVNIESLSKVKQRLRLNVIKNLNRMHLEGDIDMSSTEQELRIIQEKIRTEIRFAGLENDQHLLVLIRHRFGISLGHI
ncbi:MAG: hypothetical protein HQM11_18615 [SAR324 cluster bacterium]|nr:hypothetical protein [SAR324 cluster bacterium]